jgi:hypothetical protein
VKKEVYICHVKVWLKKAHQREYMKRRRSNIKGGKQIGNDINITPRVKGTGLRDDLCVGFPGGEAIWVKVKLD